MPAMRAAIYARFSTEMQSASSVDDQLARCERFAGERGWLVVDRFADRAVSGATRERPGLGGLMGACEAGRVDVVLVEDLSRLSRDTGDAFEIKRRLDFLGVAIVGAADGIDTRDGSSGGKLAFGIRSLFSSHYRDDLADKTLRGLRGLAEQGLATGGVPYGYRSVRDGAHSRIEIDAERAVHVRRIFAAYAAGHSYAQIAARLNADGVPAPRAHPLRRGNGWIATAVRVVLRNPRYAGTWAWGERQWTTPHPETRRRRWKRRAGGALVTTQRPELAIVDPETWAIVDAKMRGRAPPVRGRRAEYPLSGLLVCGACGGTMVIHSGGSGGPRGPRYYRCGSAHKRGTCTQRSTVREGRARAAVLGAMRSTLESGAMAEVVRIAAEVLSEARSNEGTDRAAAEARLRRATERAGRLVDALASGLAGSSTVSAELRRAEAEADDARARLAEIAAMESSAALPTAQELVALALSELDEIAAADPAEARERLRATLGTVSVHAVDGGHELRGWLDPLSVATRPPGGGTRAIGLVAGARESSDRTPPPWAVPMVARVAA